MITAQLKSLLTLQQKDLTLIQLKKEAQGIPKRQEALKENAQAARDKFRTASEAVKTCAGAIRQIELDVETVRQQINKYKNQQMQAKTNEEYKAFETEIATAAEKISALEDRELEEMSRLDRLKSEEAEAKKVLDAAEEKVASDVQALEERMEVIRSTFAEIKEGRDEWVAQVDKEIADRYLQLLHKNQDAVVVPIRQQCCGGCHMKLTPQILHDAHSQQKWTNCTFCGRMLYDDGE
ncbi:MAG: zinc ribbon domain-containing protein [Kiritimatiellia bacterium]